MVDLPLLRRGALLTLLIAPLAAPALPRIERMPDAQGADTVVLRVSGERSKGCAPRLHGMWPEGRELVLLARPDPEACRDTGGRYELMALLPQSALKATPAGQPWRVRFEMQDDAESEPRLVAFALIDTPVTAPASPEPGFWWSEAGGEFDAAGPGLGVQIERQADTLALTVAGYAEDGTPEWLFGAAESDGGSTLTELSRLAGGRGPFGGYRSPGDAEPAGRLQIEWLGSARAVFWFSRPSADGRSLELRPVSMVRFDFAGQAGPGWLGRWLIDAETPLRVDFDGFEPNAVGFVLHGNGGEMLSCWLESTRPQSPPKLCQLQFADQRPTVWFDDIGLNRLRGASSDGTPAQAVLLER